MKVLSLFDGMACGVLAMMASGVKVDRYVAYEIDKYAVKTATHNFPQIEECGDVFAADFTQYQGFDFLVGGSPCTYWSIAQKNNRETEASGLGWELFSQYVRALKEAKPRYFIYENNKSMSRAIRDSIRETFGFEEICINSALVSAQNRQRFYWVGKYNPTTDWYGKVDIQQPEDRGILLKDVLDCGGAFYETQDKKSFCLPSSYYKAGDNPFSSYGNETRRQRVAEPVRLGDYGAAGQGQRIYTPEAKAVICDTANHGLYALPVRVGCMPSPDGTTKGGQANRVYSVDGKSTNLVANAGGAGGKTGLYAAAVPQYATPCEWDENGTPLKAVSGADGKVYTVYCVKDGQITIKGKSYPIKLADGYYIIRKLTVSECKRLQTVPEWYDFSCVSNTQAYKMLGNGWTVEAISHLIDACLKK